MSRSRSICCRDNLFYMKIVKSQDGNRYVFVQNLVELYNREWVGFKMEETIVECYSVSVHRLHISQEENAGDCPPGFSGRFG